MRASCRTRERKVTLHKLNALGMNDDLWDSGLGSRVVLSKTQLLKDTYSIYDDPSSNKKIRIH